MRALPRSRAAIGRLVVVIAVAMGLSACSLTEQTQPKYRDGWCTDSGDLGCYHRAIAAHYCWFVQARDMVEKGRLKVTDLPRWADTRRRNGRIIILDFAATEDPMIPAQRRDQLRAHLVERDLPIPSTKRAIRCGHSIGQRDIERTDGNLNGNPA